MWSNYSKFISAKLFINPAAVALLSFSKFCKWKNPLSLTSSSGSQTVCFSKLIMLGLKPGYYYPNFPTIPMAAALISASSKWILLFINRITLEGAYFLEASLFKMDKTCNYK